LASNSAPARVISMSFAGKGACPSYLQSAVSQAVSLGALLISAAGNQGLETVNYFPANCRGVMAVAATTREGRLAGYSNHGSDISLSAPGGDEANPIVMLSMDDVSGIAVQDFGMGTSFAVPQVAGVAALAISIKWDIDRLRTALQVLTTKMDWTSSFGIVNSAFCYQTNEVDVRPFIFSIDINIFSNSSGINGLLLDASANALPLCTAGSGPNSNYNFFADLFYIMCSAPNWVCGISLYDQGYAGIHYFSGVYISCCSPSGSLIQQSQTVEAFNWGSADTLIQYAFVNPIQSFTYTCQGDSFPGYSAIGDTSGGGQCLGYKYVTSCPANQYVTGVSGYYSDLLLILYGNCNYLCTNCVQGHFSASGSACQPCNSGKYASSTGASSCAICLAGTYSGNGASVCTNCSMGYYCPNTNMTTPIPCNGGYYCSNAGQISRTSCNAGYYCPNSGSLSSSTSCPVGFYCPGLGNFAPFACPLGSYCPVTNLSVAVPCTAGTYSSTIGANTSSVCTACPAGTYTNTTGATVCSSCASGTTYTSTTGSISCTACTNLAKESCANDQFLQACTVTTDTKCVPCANKIDNANPTPVCVWTCFLGSYFKNSSGLCQPCKTNLVCPVGSFTLGCNTVTDQTCSPCTNLPASNAYYTTNGGLGTLQSPGQCNWACNAGYFQATPQDTGCTTCPAGSISAAGSTACTPCPAGTYAATASLCLSCPSGMYASTAGSTACLSCTWCTAQGMYKQCGGSSAGTCSTCSN